jgi:hypothetical protein
MSATYDEYKEEACRLLITPEFVQANIKRHIAALKSPYPMVGCAECYTLNENHYEIPAKLVMTVAGSAGCMYNRPMLRTDSVRGHNRWLVRKLKEFGPILGSCRTLVTTRKGTVYFSYHLIVKQESHITDS